ncbi:hypothetical protein KHX12_05390 [butyrate-producing bacterium]|nr:hypothetical protein [butyrate-producing bacterium]
MDNIRNYEAEQAAEEKYTYSQMLTILEAFSDDELAAFGQCTLNDMLEFLNNPNGIDNMMENCKANINAAFVEIALLRKLEKAMSKNLEPAETEEPEKPEKKEKSNRSVNWHYPSFGYEYGRRNPYGYTMLDLVQSYGRS